MRRALRAHSVCRVWLLRNSLHPEASSVRLATMNEHALFRRTSLALLLFSGALGGQTPKEAVPLG